MARKLVAPLFIFLLTWSVYGQQDFLRGRVLDAQTQEPVPFATVRVKGYALGVISNSDGGFQIPRKFKQLGGFLVISCMGYETREIPLDAFLPDQIAIIRLGPGVLQLSEAVVRAEKKKRLSARAIVRRAIAAIPKNYPINTFSTVGYYRDYQLKESNYVNLNEAILEVFDQGFQMPDQTTSQVKFYEYKENVEFERDSLAQRSYNYESWEKVIDKAFLKNYGGNEFTILRIHDAIRNHNIDSYDFVNRFDQDLLNNHTFTKEDNTYLADEVLYTISVRKVFPAYSALGTLYISKRDFAIHKMAYALYDNTKQYDGAEKGRLLKEKKLIFEVSTEYHRIGDKMYLNYISFHNTFQLRLPPLFNVREIVTNIQSEFFKVEFNQMPNFETAILPKNYGFKFNGKRLKFKEIEVDSIHVRLYPDLNKNESETMFRQLYTAGISKPVKQKMLSVEFGKIRDIHGNLLHAPRYQDYDQFREFFVQQVKPYVTIPTDTLFMKKDRPIFKDQPIAKPDNFADYWMNTPLQKVEH
ncbi:MAG: carboxypeptidase-like regulatory domain-containing protein [Flavobacteriales bacterium]|nr:MAG: carboxypeptidase-like regulatory domain-containing protein [Flavobacteriales bacterium]